MNKLLFIFIFTLCVNFSHAQVINWPRHTADSCNISFKLPETPYKKTRMLRGVKSTVFSYKDAVNVFGLVCSDFSAVGIDFSRHDVSEYYKQLKESSLVSLDAILISETTVSYKRMLGKEIVYTQMVREKEYTYYKRMFFRNNFIYQFSIGGPSRVKGLLLDKREIYFNSIEFLD